MCTLDVHIGQRYFVIQACEVAKDFISERQSRRIYTKANKVHWEDC